MLIHHKPAWLKTRLLQGERQIEVGKSLKEHGLNTICVSGHCPNIGECWGNGTATFMILGDICTRACKFCNVKTGKPLAPDAEEPLNLSNAIVRLELKHVVITSVDRDDLEDKGAGNWAATIRAIRMHNPGVTLETLIPDFDARPELLNLIVELKPEIVSHNLETVERLTPLIRSRARYDRSLSVINYLAGKGINTKSGLMLGLGEEIEEVVKAISDLRDAGCNILTLGQYLQPTRKHWAVERYVHPDEFAELAVIARAAGFSFVESGPLVRSSYHAEKQV